jgi:type II restriction enzyme
MPDADASWTSVITGPNDLVTSYQAVRDGFLREAQAKQQKATPYVERGLQLWEALQTVGQIESLFALTQLRNDLIAAAGFSEKAQQRLSPDELERAVQEVFATIAAQAGPNFREEIFARYMLTKGDALGGQMRNWVGAEAAQHFTSELLAALQPHEVEVKQATSGKVQQVSWPGRLLLFDTKPKFIDKNIDVILLNNSSKEALVKALLEHPVAYLACGELKGGIDPAGADEHWKTAKSALDRIRSSRPFAGKSPYLFFVGAAIETAMAHEIYRQLEDGTLSHAANLTRPEQVASLARWLVNL